MSWGGGGCILGGLVGMEGKGGSGEPSNNFKNYLYLEEFLSTLKRINQTCYILNIRDNLNFDLNFQQGILSH